MMTRRSIAAVVLAAVVVVLAAAVGIRSHSTRAHRRRGEAPSAEPVVSPEWQRIQAQQFKWEQQFASAKEPAEALKVLQGLFKEAKGKDSLQESISGMTRAIPLCRELVRRWPDSGEALQARQLICECCVQKLDFGRAHDAFAEYASAVGERARAEALKKGSDEQAAQVAAEEAAAAEFCKEGEQLFQEKDYLEGTYYVEMVTKAYPGTQAAVRAHYLMGNYHALVLQYDDAIAELQNVIQVSKDEALLRKAYNELSAAQFDSGKKDEAVKTLDEMGERLSAKDAKAYAMFKGGMYQYLRGEAFYPDALSRLKKFVDTYPEHRSVPEAKRLIGRMHKKALGGIEPEPQPQHAD